MDTKLNESGRNISWREIGWKNIAIWIAIGFILGACVAPLAFNQFCPSSCVYHGQWYCECPAAIPAPDK
jgi:hypothetical protein